MSDPYQTPATLPDHTAAAKRKFWLTNIKVSAIVLAAIVILSIIWTVIKMQGAYGQLGTSGADVEALAAHIGELLVATATAALGGLIALIWLVVSAICLAALPKPVPHQIHARLMRHLVKAGIQVGFFAGKHERRQGRPAEDRRWKIEVGRGGR